MSMSIRSRCTVFLTTLQSDDFHPFLGPMLMITYALLSNTLLLTVLVAILGNTFATINADAAAEVGAVTSAL